MKRFVVVGLALIMSVLPLAGCKGDDPKPNRGPAPIPASKNQNNVNALCDYFYVRSLETLSTSGAHATINDLAGASGIPSGLRNKAKDFTGANNQAAYASVIHECQSEGWSP